MAGPNIPAALQALTGTSGGSNSTVGVQVLGSADIDFSSTKAVTIFTQPSSSSDYVVATGGALFFVNGAPGTDADKNQPMVTVLVNGKPAFFIACNASGNPIAESTQTYQSANNYWPLTKQSTITAVMENPVDKSLTGKIVVFGASIPSS